MKATLSRQEYRGRLAPSPTGHLHLGHARTFWIAQERARLHSGKLVLRIEDLDLPRCRPEYRESICQDLRWFGFDWDEGPDKGGPCAPYVQSERVQMYRNTLSALRELGAVYPCKCSRQDVLRATLAPNAGDEEPIYPGTCRPRDWGTLSGDPATAERGAKCHWRFRVPDGETIEFIDLNLGHQAFVAGRDFGDFVVWRNDDVPAYQLAVVVDDAAMGITEVVRGADLLMSTARQLLLYRALRLQVPAFYHCTLVRDEKGVRLAKRHDALSLRKLRETGRSPGELRAKLLTPDARQG
jgi:glutamyl/glutaminyl-tRNA synthetase